MTRDKAHTILIYDPGHFHAALLFAQRNSRVARCIHLYAPPGPEVEKFIALIDGFNSRAEAPTNWQLECHIGADSLDAMMAERQGEIVVLAGRNGPRLALMHRLHDAGFQVLADKPWLTNSDALPHLNAITEAAPLAVDIMTGRHDAFAALRNRIIRTPSVFGTLGEDRSQPALEFTSRHHFLKLVDGRPLQRPPWFYDSSMQGDGLVDIHFHYVDQVQWIIAPLVDDNAELLTAGRWRIPVPLDLFRESTGETAFPSYLAQQVNDDVLQLACNGRIDYRMAGVWVRQIAEWGLWEAPGGGDLHGFTARGGNGLLRVNVDPDTGFQRQMRLSLANSDALKPALEQWREEFPGLEAEASMDGYLMHLPIQSHIKHEFQFPLMLAQFLDLVDNAALGAWPADLAARIRTRYTLLAQAWAQATDRP
ncbi:MAG: hypothetical protein HOK21_08870 [Rhodospirillaceae bacterium]|nr:hypothetical protein [Rhodospirillaceae bacterium]MBT5524184.1 hypothetical protein [Rhodospirillaceae bacterium]